MVKLVAAGNDRAKVLQHSSIRFEEGDASDLVNLEDGEFDVVSIFGAMFAPRPGDVAPAIPPSWRRYSGSALATHRRRRKASSVR
ncbi:hypothetical protein ASD32_28345 [Rhizobium sp. Root483D2]|nr:hypothetical protein ASD32_28345 [Rhizobium sp. Root483D2]